MHVLDLTSKQVTNDPEAALAKPIRAKAVGGALADEWCLEINEHNPIRIKASCHMFDDIVHAAKDFVGLNLEALAATRWYTLRAFRCRVVVVRDEDSGIGLCQDLVEDKRQVCLDDRHAPINLRPVQCHAIVEKQLIWPDEPSVVRTNGDGHETRVRTDRPVELRTCPARWRDVRETTADLAFIQIVDVGPTACQQSKLALSSRKYAFGVEHVEHTPRK